MARCTLDDLVPSFRCNRIFLEPTTGNYEEYSVRIDASVYDTVEDDSGISDYLMSDTFKENIKLIAVYSRSESVKEFVDFLASYWNEENQVGLSPAKQSFLFSLIMAGVEFESSFEATMFGILLLGNEVFNSASVVNNAAFSESLEEHYDNLIRSKMAHEIDVAEIGFSSYGIQALQNFGELTFDEDGNRYYDIKLPLESLTFTNSTAVESCYMHTVCLFEINNAQSDVSIPVNSDTIQFFFKDIDECHILEEGVAATEKVQDFRITERIQEIIRPDRITIYDQVIDEVSLVSGKTQVLNAGITSDLYSSYVSMVPYVPEGDNILTSKDIKTNNRFFLNIYELCKRNSSVRFVYDNLAKHNISGVFSGLRILDTRVKIIRKGTDISHPLQDSEINISSSKLSKMIMHYEFEDLGIRKLTDGRYLYNLELDFVDPMYEFMEEIITPVKNLLSRYNKAMTYIHNNPQNYNEIRDELNLKAQSDLRALFEQDSQLLTEALYFDILFKALTGESYMFLRYASSDTEQQFEENAILDISVFERRRLENSRRIIEDLLDATSRFFSVAEINNGYANSAKNPSKVITYSRTWNTEVSPRAFKDGVMSVIQQDRSEVSEFDYKMRMDLEKSKHNITFNVDSKDLGFMTPSFLAGDNPFASGDPIGTYLNLFANILESGDVVDDSLANALLDTNPDGYNGTVRELKNGSGMFESFLSSLGGTIENLTIDSIDTKVEISKKSKRLYSSGIDNGENLLKADSSNYGRIEIITDDDQEDIEEKRSDIKQTLFLEKVKIEDVTMRMLINRDGYSILDRRSFKQGDKNSRSFDYNFNYSSNVADKPNPILHYTTEKYFRLSENGAGSEISMPLARFVLDNTFMVFYLAGFDENMNPDWRQLSNIENARQIASSPANETGGVLCKLKRFQNSKMQIGQGSTSDREILSRYFYLYLD